MMDTEIAIIVLDHQTPDLTFACVRSLEGEVDKDCRVVVLETGAVDDSAALLGNAITDWGFDGWVRVVPAERPRLVAAAPFSGISALRSRAYVVIDGRTTVMPGAIRELRKAMASHPDAGILGARVLDRADDRRERHARIQDVPAAALTESPREVGWVSPGCRLIRREVVAPERLLAESRDGQEGNADLCHEALRAGMKILYVPTARVVHRRELGDEAAAEAGPRRRPETAGRSGATADVLAGAATLVARPLARAYRAVRDRLAAPTADRQAVGGGSGVSASRRPVSPKGGVGQTGAGEAGTGGGDDPHAQPLPRGEKNLNPADISLVNLVREDFRTHDHDLLAPGFWAIALHRFGNLRMDFPQPFRAPATLLYRTGAQFLDLTFGIDLPYTVKLGRRVRIWYHGDIRLGARAIGDDVHIRHNTTFGLVSRSENTKKPIIEDRVDIGTGVCILGDVTVGHDSVIGANSVVVRSFPPHSVLFGVPARPVGASVPTPESRPAIALSQGSVSAPVRRFG